ncbi:hypothetical protein V7417_05190 [Bacillus pumilus]|uniref:hypothetical protein n=1 Tax=Bacillus pumilus TaxID=1408 RepID=UPI002FFD94F8
MTAVLKINEELNGIELYFDNKPGNETLTHLKSNGFRYSGFKKCWWSKRTNESLEVANDITKNKITYIETKDQNKKMKKMILISGMLHSGNHLKLIKNKM